MLQLVGVGICRPFFKSDQKPLNLKKDETFVARIAQLIIV